MNDKELVKELFEALNGIVDRANEANGTNWNDHSIKNKLAVKVIENRLLSLYGIRNPAKPTYLDFLNCHLK
jgi:hypothetical protein